jgi:hypothetical protein
MGAAPDPLVGQRGDDRPVWQRGSIHARSFWGTPMTHLYRMSIAAFVTLVAATSFVEAACGDRGGPGYRGPDGKCVILGSSWPGMRLTAHHAMHQRENCP